ncbi:hypothetical protein DFP72DRAFT_830399, partial [Ephemerocybe angulata]
YDKWCERTGFTTMLPKAVASKGCSIETQRPMPSKPSTATSFPIQPAPMSSSTVSALFQQAAEEWLIMTNQPIDALSHPKFHELIQVAAARATDGVTIPEKRAVRESIIRRFSRRR